MKTIKFVKPTLEISESVAIVGSSSKLLTTEYGKKIDELTNVIRFNRAPINGYEKHVGSKEDIRVCNMHVFSCRPMSNEFTDQPQFFVRDLRNTRIITMGPSSTKINFHVGKQFVHESCQAYEAQRLRVVASSLLSTIGLVMIDILVRNNITPHVFGFYGRPNGEGHEGLTHYWESRSNKSVHHRIGAERQYLDMLTKSGKIVYYE